MGFFDKLIGGDGEQTVKEKSAKKEQKGAKLKVKPSKKTTAPPPKIEIEEENNNDEDKTKAITPKKSEKSDFEGELAIDVFETDGDFIIQSTIAGVKTEDLDITIENDIVTIKGSREKQTSEQTKKYYYQECYWGTFSRQVILPEEVDGSKAEASLKDGVLTLRIPKVEKIQKRKISIRKAD